MKNANLLSPAMGLMLAALVLAGCERREPARAVSVPASPVGAGGPGAVVRYGYEIVRTWPHDRGAFTQGLVFRNGGFLESTGLVGRSSLRSVQMETGQVVRQVAVPPPYFGEGLAVIEDRAFVLTWQHQKGFVFDANTFRLEREFTYAGEGWGLATDGRQLFLSDGTNRIRIIDPATFVVLRTIDVKMGGQPLGQLNELEFIHGEIFANIWQTNTVARIDPATGQVRGMIDFTGLLDWRDLQPGTDVLNGIAYDAAGDRLFVTGKCWPKIFEVRLKAVP